MSSAVLGVAEQSVPQAASRWIISRREDLTWFIGSGAVSYVVLGLMALGVPVPLFQFFWFFFIDGPHVISTVTRTYFDKAERQKLGWFLWILIPLTLSGPIAAWAGQASLFFLFAVVWQHFHIVKQHFGFVMLYKAKNRERDPKDLLLDRRFLLVSLFLPLAIFIVRTRPMVGQFVPDWVVWAAVAAYGILGAAWVARQVEKFRAGVEMNWPKVSLLAAVVPLQWFALLYASRFGPDGILRAGITLGLFHSFQYHRLMWFHNHNRYTLPGAEERNGFAVKFATSAFKYMSLAIGLHFTLAFLPTMLFPSGMMQAAMWGLAFTHYCLDAKIWRVRSDRGLAEALGMGH